MKTSSSAGRRCLAGSPGCTALPTTRRQEPGAVVAMETAAAGGHAPGVLLLVPALPGRALRPPPALGVRKLAGAGGTGGVPTTACSPALPILLLRLRSTTGRAWRRPPLMKPPAQARGPAAHRSRLERVEAA